MGSVDFLSYKLCWPIIVLRVNDRNHRNYSGYDLITATLHT